MVTKQCKFADLYGDVHGGIYIMTNGQTEDIENDYIICGCCGGIFQLDDDSIDWWSIYPDWVNISQEIIGE